MPQKYLHTLSALFGKIVNYHERTVRYRYYSASLHQPSSMSNKLIDYDLRTKINIGLFSQTHLYALFFYINN